MAHLSQNTLYNIKWFKATFKRGKIANIFVADSSRIVVDF